MRIQRIHLSNLLLHVNFHYSTDVSVINHVAINARFFYFTTSSIWLNVAFYGTLFHPYKNCWDKRLDFHAISITTNNWYINGSHIQKAFRLMSRERRLQKKVISCNY